MRNLKEFDSILQRITGKSMRTIAEDLAAGKSEQEMAVEVSEYVRSEHEKSDTLKNACDGLCGAAQPPKEPTEK